MAKDKQQDQHQQQTGGNLFGGVDGDKAITFQRAVFIVCNLKRIIRRPKKDQHDKSHLAAGTNSRKRSGDSGKAYDGGARSASGLPDRGVAGENHHGPGGGGGGRGLRFRNPIRRAFTLPVILCESFAGITSEQQQQHQRRLAAAQISGENDDDDDGSDLYTLDSGQSAAIESPPVATGKLRFSVPAATADSEDQSQEDHVRLRRSPARRQRRRDRRNTGTGTTTSPLSFNALECDIDRAAAAAAAADAVQLGSLSCLVTPIRRANQTATTTRQQPSKSARSKGGRKSVQIPAPVAPASSLPANQTSVFHQRPPGDCHGNMRQLATGGGVDTLPPICCPIWSLAMELLDMSQLQPRDQTRHSHLLGAPASAPYLLVPAPRATKAAENEPRQQSLVSQTGSDGEFQSLPPPNIQVDTGEAQHQDDDDDESETQQHSREKRLSSESIGEQRMICGRMSKSGGAAGSPEHNSQSPSSQAKASKSRNKIEEDQATAAARLRMKRFSSSALCLNEPPTTPEAGARRDRASDKSPETRNHMNDGPVAPKVKSGGKKSGSRPTLAPTLETLDPIVQYARQRRPSVSNQGTLNVDQQALFSAVECNQLERVKSILDGGGQAETGTGTGTSGAMGESGDAPKVNVNSLNGDKLTCLDVAVLLRNTDMVRMLQAYGAKESSACLTREGRENQLYGLYMEARRLVEDLSRSLNAIGGGSAAQPVDHFHLGDSSNSLGGGASLASSPTAPPAGADLQQHQHAKPQQLMLATGSLLSSALFEEKQRQLAYWRRRLELFIQMRYGFEKLTVPNAPELVVLQVVGESSLGVKIVHSLQLSRESVTIQPDVTAGDAPVAPSSGQGRNSKNQLAGPLQRRHRRPLRKLVARAQDRKLICPLGLACSHWLMDEFVAHKHQSDQFQMPPITSGVELAPSGASHQGPVAEFATVKSARQRGAAISASNASQRQHQEKLAIFNQLLAQQLTILSNQQRQQQRLELANNSRYRTTTSQKPAFVSQQQQQEREQVVVGTPTRLPRPRPQHLLCAHQAESTDSAYDNLAAAAASSHQQQQQAQQLSSMLTVQATSSLQFSPSSTGLAGYVAASKNGHDSPAALGSVAAASKQQPYRSLAYQLMSAKKRCYTPAADGSPTAARPTDSLPFERVSNSAAAAAAEEVAPQSPECDLGAGGLVQIMAKPPTIITKYLVEWSLSDSFEPLAGSMIIYNTNCYPLECRIEQLANGRVYFVRVASGNHRGFSETRPTTPTCLAPSSWRQVNVGGGSGSAAANRKRFKYDEEVFRKFTKLILLNRHILDKNQIQMLQREQQSLLSASAGSNRAAGRDLLRSSNLQNKSSLINMLLLDATLPAPGMSARAASRRTKQNQTQTGGGGGLSLANKLPVLDVTAAASYSPRGSLYPSSTSTRASVTGLGDSAGQAAGYETSDSTAGGGGGGEQQQTSLRVRKNLKSFFQSNSAKFNKLNNQNKRGLYLTTVIYCPGAGSGNSSKVIEPKGSFAFDTSTTTMMGSNGLGATNRKLVVTNDDRLPVIEILNELVAPSSLMADFYWLLKINGTNWIDIKRLRQQLQKSHSSSTLHLRIKLLAAIEQMQVALNLEDIGRLFYKPIVAHDGSIVICTCRCVSNTKQVSNLSIKWTSQQKVIPRHLRNISDTIAFSAQQREKQLEVQQQQALKRRQQQQQQQQQEQQRHHSSASTCTGLSQAMGQDWSLSSTSTCYQQQPVTIGTSGSSSAHSSQDPLTATSSTPTTENNLTPGYNQAYNHAPGAITLSTCGHADDQQVVATTCAGAIQSNPKPAEVGLATSNQLSQPTTTTTTTTTNNRLLSASNAQLAMMPPELARLCESCQQALIQRRCTMASGSSSSSLASSQESQSTWSSSQFSLTSQQATAAAAAIAGHHHQQQQRSCTCSRSNSANQVLTAAGPVGSSSLGQQQNMPLSGAGHQYQQQQANCPTTTTCAVLANNNLLPTNHIGATSAPTSQRNSTHSARSASGSMSMMMMMMMGSAGGSGGGASLGNPSQPHVPTCSSGSFSLAQPSGSGIGGTPSGASGPAAAGSPNQRHTQSQQLTEAATPQKSSTYLMLASLGLYDLLLFHLSEIIEFDQASTRPLPRGLYLGFVQLQTTVESMRLLVPRRRPNMVPCARVRDNAHVSREEWDLLKRFPLISSLCLAERGQAAAASGACAASRCSDPAIWGGSSGASGSPVSVRRQQEAVDDHQTRQLLTLDTGGGGGGGGGQGGFDRDRAKSVSPGLMKCIAGGCTADAAAAAGAATHHHQHHHLDPPKTSAGRAQHSSSSSALGPESSLAGECEKAAQHAHSDTDLTVTNTQAAASTKTSAGRAQESAVSDSNLDRTIGPDGEGTTHARGGAHTPRTGGRRVPSSLERATEMTFVRLIGDAAKRLLSELKSQLPKHFEQTNNNNNSDQKEQLVSILNSLNDEPNNRIYHLELIELSNQVTFVLLIPAPENVCPVTSHERSNILANNRDFMLLPLQIFETIHLATYEPDLLGKYSRLSTILETDLIVAQHEHRQAFSSHEIKSTKSRVSHLQDMVAIADEFWRQLRWIVDVVSFARDKGAGSGSNSSGGCLKLATIWRHFDQLAMSASRASITSASTIANLCCIETTCLAAAAAAGAVGPEAGTATRPVGRRHGSEPGEEDEGAAPRARTNSVDDNLQGGVANQVETAAAVGSRVGEHARGRHAEIKRTSSAKQASGARARAPRLPEIQLPSSETSATRVRLSDEQQRQADDDDDTCVVSSQVSPDDDGDQEESILDVEFGTLASRGDQQQTAPRVEDEEEAIYAYHISLRDATRAAAQRKSSHTQQRRQQQQQQRQHASVGEIYLRGPRSSSDDDRLASTCGGLNLDRRQFERIAAMAAATRAAKSESHVRDTASESSCASGHVTAYKCKVRDSASASSSSAGFVRLDENLGARPSGAPEGAREATEAGVGRLAGPKLAGQLLKSTNPFLTDSFDL